MYKNINDIKKIIIQSTFNYNLTSYDFFVFKTSENELIITQLKMATTSLFQMFDYNKIPSIYFQYHLEYNDKLDNYFIEKNNLIKNEEIIIQRGNEYHNEIFNKLSYFFNGKKEIKITCLYKNPILYYLSSITEDYIKTNEIIPESYVEIKKCILNFFKSQNFPMTSHYSKGYYYLLFQLKKMNSNINFMNIDGSDLSNFDLTNHFNKTPLNIRNITEEIFLEIINDDYYQEHLIKITSLLFDDINYYNLLKNE